MTSAMPSIQSLTNLQLVAIYNALRASVGKPPVKKFRDLETGRRLVSEAMETTPHAETIVNGFSFETPVPPTTAPVTPTTRQIKRRKNNIDDDAVITVLDPDYASSRKTKTVARFAKMIESKVRTVGEYRRIGTIGDVKWWIKGKKIKLTDE